MAVKDFLAKLLLGSDLHDDLAIAEREMRETQDKYMSARSTNDALEKECISINKSVNLLTQDLNTLKDEQKSLDDYLTQFLKDDEWNDAQIVLTKRLNEKREQLLNIQSQFQSSEKECGRQTELIEGLKGKKTSIENEIVNLKNEVEVLKVKSEQKGDKIKIEKKLGQQKNIRANLTTLHDEWQKSLEDFRERLTLADADKQNLLALQREIEDYERRVKNAIEISVA